jgi:predicted nucleic acid-binding protein
MSDRFFLDTNIFAYSLDLAEPSKAQKSERLIDTAIETGKGVISYQVAQEFFNLAFKKFRPPMPAADSYTYFISTLRPLLKVPFSQALLFQAISLREKHSIPWYDSLILAAAIESECKILYSEDFQHGRKVEGVKIVNPFV